MLTDTLSRDNNARIVKTIKRIEKKLGADLLLIFAPISEPLDRIVKRFLERLNPSRKNEKNGLLLVILETNGGSAEVAERISNLFRHFYKRVHFLIRDHAYSAGTIITMSGDEIFMNYYSVLGPIDPQVKAHNGKWVSAMNYLDKIDELLEKVRKNEITSPEFLAVKEFDLGELKAYEQAKNLSVDLVTKWLTLYNLYAVHETEEERKDKAKKIAESLVNNSQWKTHGRPLGIDTIRELGVNVKDYQDEKVFDKSISVTLDELCDCFEEYTETHGFNGGIMTREDSLYAKNG